MTRDNNRKRGGEAKEGLSPYDQKVEQRWDKIARAKMRRAPDNSPDAGIKMHADDGKEHRF